MKKPGVSTRRVLRIRQTASLNAVDCILDDFLGIAKCLFCFAFDLFCQTLGLLVLAVDCLADGYLDFPGDVFRDAFDLILVHVAAP